MPRMNAANNHRGTYRRLRCDLCGQKGITYKARRCRYCGLRDRFANLPKWLRGMAARVVDGV